MGHLESKTGDTHLPQKVGENATPNPLDVSFPSIFNHTIAILIHETGRQNGRLLLFPPFSVHIEGFASSSGRAGKR